VRWTLLRFRSDQLMELCWKWLVPIGVALVAGAAPGCVRAPRSPLMGHFNDTLRALWATLRNGLPPQPTVSFPRCMRPRAERYRASFALLHDEHGDEACIGCLQCERICPSQVISDQAGGKRESPVTGKKRGYADDFTLDLNACIFCELCVQVCPHRRHRDDPGARAADVRPRRPRADDGALYENEKTARARGVTARS
jgi:ferredoxin